MSLNIVATKQRNKFNVHCSIYYHFLLSSGISFSVSLIDLIVSL